MGHHRSPPAALGGTEIATITRYATARAMSSILVAELRHHLGARIAATATVRAAGAATDGAVPDPVARGAAPPAGVRNVATTPVARPTRGTAPPVGVRIPTPSMTTAMDAAQRQQPPRNGAPHQAQPTTSCGELLLPPPYSSPALPQVLVLMLPSQELLPPGLVSL